MSDEVKVPTGDEFAEAFARAIAIRNNASDMGTLQAGLGMTSERTLGLANALMAAAPGDPANAVIGDAIVLGVLIGREMFAA